MNKLSISLRMSLLMTLLTGVIYPLLVTGIAEWTMPQKASGNFISFNGKIVGAKMIAQKFESDHYFWPRPSAIDYNPLPSGASNWGPTSALLKEAIEKRRAIYNKLTEQTSAAGETIVPAELLFASGSGLDPHITPKTALFQLERVLKARGAAQPAHEVEARKVIERLTERRTFGILGVFVVNVLQLNLEMDKIFPLIHQSESEK